MFQRFLTENDSWYLFLFRLVLAAAITYDFSEGAIAGHMVPGHLQYSFLILLHPYIMRLFSVQLSAKQMIWISVGIFLHPIGIIYDLYLANIHWDTIAHLYAGTIVGGLIMTVIWSLDWRKAKSALIGALLIIVVGILWELFEIMIADHLTVYGNWDIVMDIVYNTIGWATVYFFGRDWLSNVVDGFRSFREQKSFS